jgi:Protease inhibitor Inh
MNAAIILAAALSVANVSHAQGDALAARAAIGQWRLSEVGGKLGCTVNFTDRAIPGGGQALQAPSACHLAFPPLKELSVWSLDAHGAPIFSDAAHKRVVAFAGPPGGPFQAIASDGKAWRLEPAAPHAPATPSP